ncbi:MAG TPA: hypothetical protein VFO85_11150, partial [Vicinamibacteria bacterium]|nr:hypothetical protein [Vicinamibacteria bacterium]
PPRAPRQESAAGDDSAGPGREEAAARIRAAAWEGLGLERDAQGISALLAALDELTASLPPRGSSRSAVEARNLADVARAMALSALFREESRGGHFRTDFPSPDDRRFRGHTFLLGGRCRLADVDLPLGAVSVAGHATGAAASPGGRH